jgi:hypothetical protein
MCAGFEMSSGRNSNKLNIHMKIGTKKLFVAALYSLTAAVCANAQNLNGTLAPGFYGTPVYVQTINTGFGNSTGANDSYDDNGSGSELDAVYAVVSGGNLYLFISGSLQDNGNTCNIFISDGVSGGQNTVNISDGWGAAGMNGSIFTNNFNANLLFTANDSSGTLYVDQFVLGSSGSVNSYLGGISLSGGVGSGGVGNGSVNGGGPITVGFNNTLVSTMGTSGTALSGSSSGANTTTGLELEIPLSSFGYTGGAVTVFVCIDNGSYNYLSNQFLPGLAVGSANLGTSTFNFSAVPTPTNYVTFTLDMSEQVAFGNFTNTDENPSDPNYGQPVNSIAVAGNDFDGWGTGDQLTNYTILNPTDNNPGLKTNWYIGTFPVVSFLPTQLQWKFRVNNLDGGYEQPVSTAGGNRVTTITQSNTVLPVISYDDEGLGDLVISPLTVNFSVLVTNGTPSDTGYQFVKGSDEVFVNGAWLGWPTWGVDALPPDQQMMEVGTSDVYTNSFVIPRGTSIYMTYKYSFNGVDDENGTGTNHIREIRSYGPVYNFPQDVWSWTVLQPGDSNPYPDPGIASTNIVEPDFGNLQIGAPSGGNLPITWLGRPAVLLQNVNSFTGTWNTLSGTDGTQSTNWPNAGKAQFFRLIKQ